MNRCNFSEQDTFFTNGTYPRLLLQPFFFFSLHFLTHSMQFMPRWQKVIDCDLCPARRRLGLDAAFWILTKNSGTVVIISHWLLFFTCWYYFPWWVNFFPSMDIFHQGKLLNNSFSLFEGLIWGCFFFLRNKFNLPCIKVCSKNHRTISG